MGRKGENVDHLSELMEGIRLRSMVWCRNELRAPWGIRLPGNLREIPESFRPNAPTSDFPLPIQQLTPPTPEGGFYVLTEGQCWLHVDGLAEGIPLHQGDLLVLLPRGRGHCIRDNPDSPVQPIWELRPPDPATWQQVLRHGGQGPLTKMICGVFLFEHGPKDPLLSALPPIIHMQAEAGCPPPWLAGIVSLIAHESAHYQTGTLAVLNLLANLLLAQAIRTYVQGLSTESDNWLRAFLDPDIGKILALVHRHPEASWTVASMAESVAMSRSAFATRFTSFVGESPRHYVTACRMHKAEELLAKATFSIKEVARCVGYESEAAFSVAFKRFSGMAPIVFKKHPHGKTRPTLPELTLHPQGMSVHPHYYPSVKV